MILELYYSGLVMFKCTPKLFYGESKFYFVLGNMSEYIFSYYVLYYVTMA